MSNSIDAMKTQLAQLKELHASGVLPQAQFDEARANLERRILDAVLTADPASFAAAPAPAMSAPTTDNTPAVAAKADKIKPPKALLAAVALGVLVLAGVGYVWKGSPALLHSGATEKMAAQAGGADGGNGANGAPHSTNAEQIAAMTEKLVARLKDKPDDWEGWAMLGRTYEVLQRSGDAVKAYEKAVALRKDDAGLLADYADAMAVNQAGKLDGEPMKMVERALRIDPKNLKALALAGTFAFNQKDYASAAKIWQKLVDTGPADNLFVKEIGPGLAEARKLAGLPPMAQPLDAAKGPLDAPKPVNAAATVSGTVKLAPALAKQVSPEDTVFVFARPAEGSRMPLAIMRRQVKDLPLHFTLDDSMAMSPTNALSGASKVIVGARISKSGNAMPQAGDLQGLSGVVSVGSAKVDLEIKDAVKP